MSHWPAGIELDSSRDGDFTVPLSAASHCLPVLAEERGREMATHICARGQPFIFLFISPASSELNFYKFTCFPARESKSYFQTILACGEKERERGMEEGRERERVFKSVNFEMYLSLRYVCVSARACVCMRVCCV